MDDRRQNPIVCPTLEGDCKKKKAPKTGASKWNLFFSALLQGAPELLLFLRSSLLLGGGFLGCAFHRLILPNIKFCDWKIAM
jgi:hypothetical protein